MVYNVLNFPAGVVRMTSVTDEDDEQMKDYSEHDMYHRRVKKVRLHSGYEEGYTTIDIAQVSAFLQICLFLI